MRANTINKYIEFQQYTESYDEVGQPVFTWEHFCYAWGNFNHLSGQERWLAAQVQAEGTVSLIVRFIPVLEQKLRDNIALVRVKMGDRTFEIHSFRDLGEERKQLEIDIKEIL